MATPRAGMPKIMISDPTAAAKVLRNREMTVASIGPHLERLEAATGEDFSNLRKVIQSSLIYQEGASHLQTRRILAQFFGEKSMADWHEVIDAQISAQINHLEASPNPDLVRDFTDPLFSNVISRLIGLRHKPETDLIELVALTRVLTEPLLSLREIRSMSAALNEIIALIPTDGFDPAAKPRPLAQIIAEDQPQMPEGVSIFATIAALVVAAHTMAESLAFCLWGLLSGDRAPWVAAAQDGWRDQHLERLLSLYPSTLFLYRVANSGDTIGGCPVAHGQSVTLDMPGINNKIRATVISKKGAAEGECPLRQGQIMSFGTGAHKCPGEALARLTIGLAVPALARRFPKLTLHRDKVQFLKTEVVQTPSALPCDLQAQPEKIGKVWHVKDATSARAIITDDTAFEPPQMIDHLVALSRATGLNLDVAIRMARNAMFFMSGPRHDTARKLVSQFLGGNRLKVWEPLIDATIQQAIDQLLGAPNPDLVRDFSEPLCQTVNKQVLGIHPSDDERFNVLAPEFHQLLEPMLPVKDVLALQDGMSEALALLAAGPSQDAAKPLRPGLLQVLLSEQHIDFEPDDCRALALILYGAGFNMTNTLSNALHWILTLPPEDRLGIEESQWTARRLETILSLLAAPKYIYRMANRDIEVGGMQFAARDTAQIHLAKVNIGVSTGHLSFGHGLHRCVGAALTRMTIKKAIPALFNRCPNILLEPQDHRYFNFSQTVALKSLKCKNLSR